MADTTAKADEKPKKAFANFLESNPPDTVEDISNLCKQVGANWQLVTPDIQLHCSSEACDGLRFFQSIGSTIYPEENSWKNGFMAYVCRNCGQTQKIYALAVFQNRIPHYHGKAIKYGESPPFGPPIPSRVISLIGPDRDLFLAGRRAENHGLGIGAFAYYRRVVENQKGRIIIEIGKVAKRLGASAEEVAQYENAAKETQFSAAIEQVKTVFPTSLKIEAHNPLTLLHSALSEGIHAQTDVECLEIAQEIRLVLIELAERISQALKEQAELKQAVSKLLSRKQSG